MTPSENIQTASLTSTGYSSNGRLSKYSVLACLYFFFNSVFLPKGLLYTTILSPIFFYKLIRQGSKTWLLPFGIFLGIYSVMHLYIGVDLKSFIISTVLFIFTYFFTISVYHFVNHYSGLGKLFKQIVAVNTILAIIALPFFFAPKNYQTWFWYINELTRGLGEFPRLALFTYEASYYSLMLTPVLYYYVFKFLFGEVSRYKWGMLFLVSVPVLMSLSFGVIGAAVLTAFLLCLYFWRRIFKFRRSVKIIALILVVVSIILVLLLLVFPQNFMAVRFYNIMAGTDTSANGRTVDSFGLAWRLASSKNIFFGIGLGQIKITIVEMVHKYYNYWGNFSRYDIPNAMGETLAIFGLVGVALRLFLECYLFFKTKVYNNYYRFALFLFIFIYQFTGSFITNSVEYVIWALAFSRAFNQFNVTYEPRPTYSEQIAVKGVVE